MALNTPNARSQAAGPAPPTAQPAGVGADVGCSSPGPSVAAWTQVFAGARKMGPLAAWFAAVVWGWRLYRGMDLLDVVLRAAGLWLGVLVLWLSGIRACERVVGRVGWATRPRKGSD